MPAQSTTKPPPDRREWQAAYDASHRAEKAAYYLAHREEKRVSNAAYRVAHREELAAYRASRRKEIAASQAAYRATHREEKAAYKTAHREQILLANAAYYLTHREQTTARKHIRHARLAELPSERVLLSVLFERDRGICGICRKRVYKNSRDKMMRPSHDHILPVSHGGANTYANARLAHRRCNVARNNRGAAQLRFV